MTNDVCSPCNRKGCTTEDVESCGGCPEWEWYDQEKERNVKMETERTKMAAPWVQYVNALKAMFAEDQDVHVVYDDSDPYVVKLLVDSHAKADALSSLLPQEKVWGNVALKISVVPGNKEVTKMELFRNAFAGNPALVEVVPTNPITYVSFQKKVVQYYNDNLSDPHGNRTTLFEELARDLFREIDGVYYCTDKRNWEW